MKIKVVTTNNRGFLKTLFTYKKKDLDFIFDEKKLYEKKGKKNLKSILRSMNRWKIFDILGIFQIVKSSNSEADVEFSFNRFVKGKKPYIIYLENPGALFNYNWKRNKYLLTKIRLNKYLKDSKLKGLICMSESCMKGLEKYYTLPKTLMVDTIFPLIKDRTDIDENIIYERSNNPTIKCLFVAEYFRRKGGKDVLNLFKRINEKGQPFELTIVTAYEYLDDDDKRIINQCENITYHDFTCTKEEMMELYKESSILLNPTRWDSSSLVTLEAIKSGCVIVGSNIYALKEMVPGDLHKNITNPYIRYWNDDYTINIDVAMNPKYTLDSEYIDSLMVDFMYERLSNYSINRNKLYEEQMITFKYSKEEKLGESFVFEKWKKTFAICNSNG